MNDIKDKILSVISLIDYRKGMNYDEDLITYIGKNIKSGLDVYNFLVHSESSVKKYRVNMSLSDNNIEDIYCDCPQFNSFSSCKHVAACLISYSDIIFSKSPVVIKDYSKDILANMTSNISNNPKKKITIIPEIIREDYYYGSYFLLKVKLGYDKFYSLLGKLSGFMEAYRNEEKYSFGVNFIYDPNLYYISDEDYKFLELLELLKKINSSSGNELNLNSVAFKLLLKTNHKLYDELDKEILLIKAFPYNAYLKKEDNQYQLSFSNSDIIYKSLTEDGNYLYDLNNTIYQLSSNEIKLYKLLKRYNTSVINFKEEEFDNYQRSILKVIKNNLRLDESVKNIIIDIKPLVKLYLDLNEDNIICNVIFKYQDNELNYFDKSKDIIRDNEYESKVIEDILENGFIIDNNKLVIDDFEQICLFIDEKLDELSEKYDVYTSEKIKETNILKKNKVSSTFHIGTDNILHFDFSIDGVDSKELDNILNSLKDKKKYYHLQNGNILSLDNNEIEELSTLVDELDIDADTLESRELPKYKALYLDSIKNRYNLNTNSLFDDFITNFYNYKDEEITFNEDESYLRDYQKDGVKWLRRLSKCNFGGILADEMGLGKSVQTLIYIKKMLEEDKTRKFLIVSPTSLIYNWEHEIKKFASDLTYHVFGENKIIRQDSLKNFEGNVYITSYGLLREDLDLYKDKNFYCMIIDEAQNIKNPGTGLTKAVKRVKASIKFALTGTPIENSIVELWSIFDYIMPGFLSNLMHFERRYKIDDFNEETNKLLDNLKEQVRPFILRRKKEDVIKDLPEKTINNIFIDLSESQKKVYASEVSYVKNKMDNMIKTSGFNKNKMEILALLTRLREICIDPSILYENYNEGSSKIDTLLDIINEYTINKHKILLFTSFKKALELVRTKLLERGISSYTIAGDVPSYKRQLLVDSFNKDNTSVFLIMLKSGGTGLNLTAADTVIHLDLWWNPKAEEQATDRTHRIGQTKNVEVIKLITKGTIEEHILDLQEKKKILSDKILDDNLSDSNYLKSLTENDIRNILAYENND